MITEDLNININDIEDVDLRKKIIDYFKTIKEGKLNEEEKNKETVDKLIDSLDGIDDQEETDDYDDEADDLMSSFEKMIKKEKVDESLITESDWDDTIWYNPLKNFLKKQKEKMMIKTKMKKILKQLAYMNYMKNNADSAEERRKWEKNIKFVKLSSFDENGHPLVSKSAQRKRVAELIMRGRIDPDEIVSRKEMTDLGKKYDKLSADDKEELKEKIHKGFLKELAEDNEIIADQLAKKALKDKKKSDDKSNDDKSNDDKSDDKSDDDDEDIEDETDDEDLEDEKKSEDGYNKDPGKYNKGEGKDEKRDKDGNTLKKEVITDKDGKKKKVVTHTGPRGGKFYWPKGSPHDSDHKVYLSRNNKVQECMSLIDYLNDYMARASE